MPEGRRKTRLEHSAGGAVLTLQDGRAHVAMIATRRRTRWGLPKGALSTGETAEQAAVREVREETGLDAEVVGLLDSIEYFFRAGDVLIQKTVDFYLMRHLGGVMQPQLSEVDDVAWISLDAALEKASFDSERKLLQQATLIWTDYSEEERSRYAV